MLNYIATKKTISCSRCLGNINALKMFLKLTTINRDKIYGLTMNDELKAYNGGLLPNVIDDIEIIALECKSLWSFNSKYKLLIRQMIRRNLLTVNKNEYFHQIKCINLNDIHDVTSKSTTEWTEEEIKYHLLNGYMFDVTTQQSFDDVEKVLTSIFNSYE